jgi:hypothetical protein
MSTPDDIAKVLMSYYLNNNEHMFVHLVTADGNDNEYILEVLVQIYLGCYKLYKNKIYDITLEQFVNIVYKVILSVGYVINTDVLKTTELNEIIYFSKIVDTQALLNSYHPFRIRERIIELGYPVPKLLNDLYTNEDLLGNLVVVHDLDQSDDILKLSFRKANIIYN